MRFGRWLEFAPMVAGSAFNVRRTAGQQLLSGGPCRSVGSHILFARPRVRPTSAVLNYRLPACELTALQPCKLSHTATPVDLRRHASCTPTPVFCVQIKGLGKLLGKVPVPCDIVNLRVCKVGRSCTPAFDTSAGTGAAPACALCLLPLLLCCKQSSWQAMGPRAPCPMRCTCGPRPVPAPPCPCRQRTWRSAWRSVQSASWRASHM